MQYMKYEHRKLIRFKCEKKNHREEFKKKKKCDAYELSILWPKNLFTFLKNRTTFILVSHINGESNLTVNQ